MSCAGASLVGHTCTFTIQPAPPNPAHTQTQKGNFDGAKHAPIRTGRADLDKRVVYSPHIYGPEVFSHHNYFRDPSFPENMLDIWDYQFSWIERVGGWVGGSGCLSLHG